MLNLSSRTANVMRALQRLAAGMATAVPRIGDTKVPMSLLEKGVYINYQRIEDNLAVVRDRYAASWNLQPLIHFNQTETTADAIGKDSVRTSGRPPQPGYRKRCQLPQAQTRCAFIQLTS
jgi:aconitate hydratase